MRQALGVRLRLRVVEQDALLRPVHAHAQLLRQLRAGGERSAERRRAGDARAAPRQVPDEVFTTEYKPPTHRRLGQYPRQSAQGGGAAGARPAGRSIAKTQEADATPRAAASMDFEILLVQPGVRAHHPAVRQEPRAPRHHRRACAPSTPRSISSRLDDFDFDMIVGSWPESLSPGNEQRNFWGSAVRRPAGQPELPRHQGSGRRRAGRSGDRGARPRQPGRPRARARPRPAVGLLRHPAVASAVRPRRLLGQVRLPVRRPGQGVQLDTWWIDPDEGVSAQQSVISRNDEDADRASVSGGRTDG